MIVDAMVQLIFPIIIILEVNMDNELEKQINENLKVEMTAKDIFNNLSEDNKNIVYGIVGTVIQAKANIRSAMADLAKLNIVLNDKEKIVVNAIVTNALQEERSEDD